MPVRISTKDEPRYTFEVDGVAYSMPSMGALPIPFLRRYAQADGDEQLGIDFILDLLETQTTVEETGEPAHGLSETLGGSAVMAIFADYVKDGGEDMGESSASSD